MRCEAEDRRIAGHGTPESAWRDCPVLGRVPHLSLQALLDGVQRLVVVAPHPDDESLGVGGLLHDRIAAGGGASLIALTDGEGSHPRSQRWPAAALIRARRTERHEAMRRLGAADIAMHAAHLPDGGLARHERDAAAFIQARLCPGDRVLATWRLDGHPDHEAAGRAAAAACAAAGAALIEYPVWAWHWARPGDVRLPWTRMRRIALSAAARDAKAAALGTFASQLEPDPSTGEPAVLGVHVLERFGRAYETVIVP